MFVKMLLAFIVSICLAGGAVYYGMPDFEGGESTAQSTALSNQTTKPKNFLDKFVKKPPVMEPVKEVETTQTVTKTTTTETVSTTEDVPEISVNQNVNQTDLQDVLDQLMAQANRIEAPNLKDQAHMDIANFATGFRDFEAANLAMNKIEQKELRDTARGNIAIFMARSGMVVEAFKKVDEVEIESLRDVMRLQVIEAITIPNQMPSAIQQ